MCTSLSNHHPRGHGRGHSQWEASAPFLVTDRQSRDHWRGWRGSHTDHGAEERRRGDHGASTAMPDSQPSGHHPRRPSSSTQSSLWCAVRAWAANPTVLPPHLCSLLVCVRAPGCEDGASDRVPPRAMGTTSVDSVKQAALPARAAPPNPAPGRARRL